MNRLFVPTLWRNNKIYLDKSWIYVSSTKWNDDYYTYQEIFDLQYKPLGYYIDDRLRIRPGEKTQTIDFCEWWDILNSSDEQKLKDADWMFNDIENTKFFNKNAEVNVESTGNAVGFLSFPRMGNSFLRKFLQNVSGIQTGADMPMNMVIVH